MLHPDSSRASSEIAPSIFGSSGKLLTDIPSDDLEAYMAEEGAVDTKDTESDESDSDT